MRMPEGPMQGLCITSAGTVGLAIGNHIIELEMSADEMREFANALLALAEAKAAGADAPGRLALGCEGSA